MVQRSPNCNVDPQHNHQSLDASKLSRHCIETTSTAHVAHRTINIPKESSTNASYDKNTRLPSKVQTPRPSSSVPPSQTNALTPASGHYSISLSEKGDQRVGSENKNMHGNKRSVPEIRITIPSSSDSNDQQKKRGFFQRCIDRFRRNYCPKAPAPLVLPWPPNDTEKYSYVNMNRWPLVVLGTFSFLCLSVGMWLFVISAPYFAWYGLYAAFIQLYLFMSYGVTIFGRSFDLEQHKKILKNYPITRKKAPTVDIYLPVCKEPLEILENTWTYVRKLQYPKKKLKVFVLDDGGQDEVKDLAQRYRFNYMCRDDRPHLKKAGNLRWAFARTTGDFFTVFDADFCPRADFLLEVMPHHLFDPKAAIFQTPQYFRSHKDQTWVEQGAGAIQEFFYRLVECTRNTWGAAICVGSNAVYRRKALADVGGPYEIEFSEDVHTGYWAVHRGWRVTYLSLVLTCGICPDTPQAFFSQQMRWCMGSTTLLTNLEFYKSNLTKMQKFCYITGFLSYSAAAVGIFLNPIPGPLLLWFRPEYFKYYNLFFAVPSLVLGILTLRFWARADYNLNVQYISIIMRYAYFNALKDRFLGIGLNWSPSGDGKAHKNNKYRNMRILAWVWILFYNAALISAVTYRIIEGLEWYQVIPVLLLDAYNLFCSHRFLLYTQCES